jgi:hypothetical protein
LYFNNEKHNFMKKLELNQMESLEGGRVKLSCDTALGLGGLCLAAVSGPAGWCCVALLMLACEA